MVEYTPDFNERENGTLDPFANISPPDPDYSSAVNKLGDEIEYFTDKLSPEDEDRFSAFIALFEDVHLLERRMSYDNGFKSAVRMVLDVKKTKSAKLKLV